MTRNVSNHVSALLKPIGGPVGELPVGVHKGGQGVRKWVSRPTRYTEHLLSIPHGVQFKDLVCSVTEGSEDLLSHRYELYPERNFR